MQLTKTQFERLPLHDKTDAYFTHPDNLRDGKNRSRGPSVSAQAAFTNNWQQAFAEFVDRLPGR